MLAYVEEFFTGNPLVDEQHFKLIEKYENAVRVLTEADALKDQLLALFDLQTFADYHFHSEALEIDRIETQAAQHHTQHCRYLLQTLEREIRRFSQGVISDQELLDALDICLCRHIFCESADLRSRLSSIPQPLH